MVKHAKRVKRANVNDVPAVPIGYHLQIVPMLERYFSLKEHGTDIRTEFIAGVTTFLTMVYIVFVNPQILGMAGMDPGAVFVATCIAAAVSTFVMAFYAKYPIALAPGMGINAFFAFTVVLTYLFGRAVLPNFNFPHPAIRHRLDPA
jgi:xanthine/uracil/vitamin C permease (AzgA family)